MALSTASGGRRAAITAHVDLIVAAAERETADPADVDAVLEQADAVRQAVHGDVPGRRRSPVP